MSFSGKFLIKHLKSIILAGERVEATAAGTTNSIMVLIRDKNLDAVMARGTEVPTSTTTGYAKGCIYVDTNLIASTKAVYENIGTRTSCEFNKIGDITTGELTIAEGSVIVGDASGLGSALDASGDTKILVGNATTMTSVALSGDITMTNAGVVTLADDSVSLENIDDGILPSHVVKYAGEITWSGSGASVAETVTGALATDIVVATIQSAPTEAASMVSTAVTNDTVTVTLSAANTSNDAVISYVVYRVAA